MRPRQVCRSRLPGFDDLNGGDELLVPRGGESRGGGGYVITPDGVVINTGERRGPARCPPAVFTPSRNASMAKEEGCGCDAEPHRIGDLNAERKRIEMDQLRRVFKGRRPPEGRRDQEFYKPQCGFSIASCDVHPERVDNYRLDKLPMKTSRSNRVHQAHGCPRTIEPPTQQYMYTREGRLDVGCKQLHPGVCLSCEHPTGDRRDAVPDVPREEVRRALRRGYAPCCVGGPKGDYR